MKIEEVHEGIRYRLSNENLEVGDKVFPIAWGRCTDDEDVWVLHSLKFKDSISDFPDEPHIILDLHHSDNLPYRIRTDHGYGTPYGYFKIIKKEKKVKENDRMFASYVWVEINLNEEQP